LKWVFRIPGIRPIFKNWYSISDKRLHRELFGIDFPNPVGLAAGFDKDAEFFNELETFGFGFIEIGTVTPEIGTVTPEPQQGSPQPRLFRVRNARSLINRMGFNNKGVNAAAARLSNRKSMVVIGGNIGKNKDTTHEETIKDYLYCVEQLLPVVDYIAVNVSSPNTPDLRLLQEKEELQKLLIAVKDKITESMDPKPLLVKVSPDLSDGQIRDIAEVIQQVGIGGLIATNTTIDREGVGPAVSSQEGGLSGQLLNLKSNQVIRKFRSEMGPDFPIIGVGGIMSAEDAITKMDAGADLIQIYTGFIYEGPSLVKRINRELISRLEE